MASCRCTRRRYRNSVASWLRGRLATALLARQHGLPAFTGLAGKTWNSAWDPDAAGREIAVAYDVGAEDDAAATVDKLRQAGARRAWVVSLGLSSDGEDIGDWFLTYGRTAVELLDLIRRTRPRIVRRSS